MRVDRSLVVEILTGGRRWRVLDHGVDVCQIALEPFQQYGILALSERRVGALRLPTRPLN